MSHLRDYKANYTLGQFAYYTVAYVARMNGI